MRRPCCHTCLAFILKFLNFLQFFIGVCIVIYSAYMLNHWQRHPHYDGGGVDVIAADVISGLSSGLDFNLGSLPAPWFIYAFLGVGVVLCCITCVGHISAETVNGCCLCFYAILSTIFVLLEVSFVAFIALDRSWEKDLPQDPTGELDSLRTFIEENMDICKWVGIVVITIQLLSLLLAIILRALVSGQNAEDDIEEEYSVGVRTWDQVLNPHLSQTAGSIKGDGKFSHSDIWSSRMREKYGLNNSDARYTLLNPSSSVDTNTQQ